MNIDVKNAFDKIIEVCNGLEGKINTDIPLKKMFASDIFTFVNSISNGNAKENYALFNKLYFNGEYCENDLKANHNGDVPALLVKFCELDNRLHLPGIKLSKLALKFFTVLGQSCLSDPSLKESIDNRKISEQIKAMDEYIDNSVKQSSSERPSDDAVPQPADSAGSNAKTNDAINSDETEESEEPEETLEELLDKLNSLIGLIEVKKEVEQIINLIKVKKKGEEFGEETAPLSLHLVFYGNPGTGKTTVARLLSKIYKSLGVLSSGHLIEVDRGGLVGAYVGQTAIKTQEVIEKAKGGILFIDEAYSLTHRKGENDFGQEAVDTILKAMEDCRDNLIVIVAGYPELMKEFIASNPGLKSRFNQFINFQDYLPDELYDIFKLYCKQQKLLLKEECDSFLIDYFEKMYNNRSDDYANGRDVRNFFEKVIKARANRLAPKLDNITYEEYMTILPEDLQNAKESATDI